MKQIRGDAKNIRALLGGAKYAVDYYQREYELQTKQVAELLDDLAGMFLDRYEPGHDRSAVKGYGHYFLGSIIISDKDGRKFIIDGQQRLTTLTLLLIRIHHLLTDSEHKGLLADLIFSQKFGKRSFNLDVPERTACMEALYTGHPFDEDGQPESIVNILGRYQDTEDRFPEELAGEALPYFRFARESGLSFRPHAEFKKADLDARQALYRRLAEAIWNPARLTQEVAR